MNCITGVEYKQSQAFVVGSEPANKFLLGKLKPSELKELTKVDYHSESRMMPMFGYRITDRMVCKLAG